MAEIFVIDDHTLHRDTLGVFLPRRGHEVVVAGGGAGALAR